MQSLRDIFVRNLKFHRKRKALTQESLSLLVEMSPSYINAVETKASFPQPEVIEKIAAALGVPAYELFKYDGCPQNAMQFEPEKFAGRLAAAICKSLLDDVRGQILDAIQGDI